MSNGQDNPTTKHYKTNADLWAEIRLMQRDIQQLCETVEKIHEKFDKQFQMVMQHEKEIALLKEKVKDNTELRKYITYGAYGLIGTLGVALVAVIKAFL